MRHLNLIISVDGQYGAWGDWSQCTATCGGGQHTRTRKCDSPAPAHGGKECVGDAEETEECNKQACPLGMIPISFTWALK